MLVPPSLSTFYELLLHLEPGGSSLGELHLHVPPPQVYSPDQEYDPPPVVGMPHHRADRTIGVAAAGVYGRHPVSQPSNHKDNSTPGYLE